MSLIHLNMNVTIADGLAQHATLQSQGGRTVCGTDIIMDPVGEDGYYHATAKFHSIKRRGCRL